MHSICVWNMIKQSKPLQTRYDTTYVYDRYYIRTHVYVFLFSVKIPHTWYLLAQSFITLLKFVWREWDVVAMNERKKKCVGLQRTWVSKCTVYSLLSDAYNALWKLCAFNTSTRIYSSCQCLHTWVVSYQAIVQ